MIPPQTDTAGQLEDDGSYFDGVISGLLMGALFMWFTLRRFTKPQSS